MLGHDCRWIGVFHIDLEDARADDSIIDESMVVDLCEAFLVIVFTVQDRDADTLHCLFIGFLEIGVLYVDVNMLMATLSLLEELGHPHQDHVLCEASLLKLSDRFGWTEDSVREVCSDPSLREHRRSGAESYNPVDHGYVCSLQDPLQTLLSLTTKPPFSVVVVCFYEVISLGIGSGRAKDAWVLKRSSYDCSEASERLASKHARKARD